MEYLTTTTHKFKLGGTFMSINDYPKDVFSLVKYCINKNKSNDPVESNKQNIEDENISEKYNAIFLIKVLELACTTILKSSKKKPHVNVENFIDQLLIKFWPKINQDSNSVKKICSKAHSILEQHTSIDEIDITQYWELTSQIKFDVRAEVMSDVSDPDNDLLQEICDEELSEENLKELSVNFIEMETERIFREILYEVRKDKS